MPLSTLLVLPLALYATAAVEPPRFDAMRFFSGTTAGSGELKVVLHDREEVRVRGHGYVAENGTLVLEQEVSRGRRPVSHRIWQLREVSPGHYSGTLSDARGPVTGQTFGDRLHLGYRGKGGVRIDQWLVLAQDGRSAQNLLVGRVLGVRVARLQETIRKMD